MAQLRALIPLFEQIRELVALPDNDFIWSSWEDSWAALREIDSVLFELRSGRLPTSLQILFAPTGPMQEVAVSSGWGDTFLDLATRFDDAMQGDDCECLESPSTSLADTVELGMDDRFADVSTARCPLCGRSWLRYFYEVEGFSGSGRWYLGPVPMDRLEGLTANNARALLESIGWYFYGGSYFDGRTGKGSGPIQLSP